MRKELWIIFFLSAMICSSCGLKLGYEALEEYNYFQAKKKFESSSKKDYAPSQLGLARIYYRNDNPFHDIYKSYKAILNSDSAFFSHQKKMQEKWMAYQCSADEILLMKQKVSSKLYQINSSNPSVLSFQNFIDSNSWAIEKHEAIQKRDSIEFEIASQANTSKSMKSFMELRPDSHLYNNALAKFYKRQFQEETTDDYLIDYIDFTKNYPNSPYVKNAQDKIFHIETKNDLLESYDVFISKYPQNRNIDSAWTMLYAKYSANYTEENISAFLEKYPNCPLYKQIEEELELFKQMYLPYKKQNFWGFVDKDENIKIKAIYDYVGLFDQGLAIVVKNDKYGFINKKGEVVIPMIYDEVESFSDGLAIVIKNDEYGVIDRAGKIVLEFGLDDVGKCQKGVFYASIDGNYMFFNSIGQNMFLGSFEVVKAFNGTSAIVKNNNKYGVLSTQENNGFILPLKWEDIQRRNDNYLCKSLGKSIILSPQGDSLTLRAYDYIGEFSDDLAYVELDDFFGFIDTNYNEKIPLDNELFLNSKILSPYKNGSSRVMTKGKMGLVDLKRKKLAPSIFSFIGYWDSLIPISKGDLYGYCNKNIDKVIDYIYNNAAPFENGLAIVESDFLQGAINTKGNTIIPIIYKKLNRRNNIILGKNQDNLWMIFDAKGEQLIDKPVLGIRQIKAKLYLLEYETNSTFLRVN